MKIKNVVFGSIMLGALVITSCGSTPTELAEEVCACFDDAGDDEEKREECGQKSIDALNSLKGDLEGGKEYMNKLSCE